MFKKILKEGEFLKIVSTGFKDCLLIIIALILNDILKKVEKQLIEKYHIVPSSNYKIYYLLKLLHFMIIFILDIFIIYLIFGISEARF
jgi:hypothetical protein